MRTLYPLMVVLSIAVAGLIFQLAGVADVVQPDPADGLDSPDEFNDSASDAPVAEDGDEFSGGASNQGDGDIVGLIIAGGDFAMSIGSLVVLLPWELQDMGFPRYFAYPVGLLSQLIVSIGVVQFVINRRWT